MDITNYDGVAKALAVDDLEFKTELGKVWMERVVNDALSQNAKVSLEGQFLTVDLRELLVKVDPAISKREAVCIYHADCLDGLVAAWVVDKMFKESDTTGSIEFIPAKYGDKPPAINEGESVYIVDFSYDPEVIVDICRQAGRVVLIDHHEKAITKFEDYFSTSYLPKNLRTFFRLNQSGADIAWEVFFPNHPTIPLIKAADDYDRWNFKYSYTRPVMAYLASLPQTIASVEEASSGDKTQFNIGTALCAKEDEMVAWHVQQTQTLIVNGVSVAIVNAPHYIANWLAHSLNATYPIAVVYSDSGNERRYSFRAPKGTSYNMADLAELLGGSGHATAAGATVSMTDVVVSADQLLNTLHKYLV